MLLFSPRVILVGLARGEKQQSQLLCNCMVCKALELMSQPFFRFLYRRTVCVLSISAVVSPVVDGAINRWTVLSCNVTTLEGPPGVALHVAAFSHSFLSFWCTGVSSSLCVRWVCSDLEKGVRKGVKGGHLSR